jgi:hypothetical protein
MAPISVATGTSTPVISISQANGATSGFLSAADWTTFNAKQAAGNYITQLTGDMTLSGFASGTATATLPSVAIAGTSTKVTYDVKGRVLSGTSLAAADIPALSAAIITSGTLNVANGGTGANSLTLNNVILGNGTSPVQAVAPGTNGNVLTSNGTTWESTAIPATTWATPGTIGSNTPNTGAFTSITSNAQAGYEAKPFGVNAGNTGEVRFDELAANGTNYIGFKAPDILAANKVWVLPAADGTAGQVLKTDGVGNLSWVSAATGSVTSVGITAPASGITVTGGPITSSGSMTLALSNDIAAVEALTTTGLAKRTAADSWTTVTDNSSNWDAAYSDRLKWDGGSTDLNAATARTSLGLGSLATMSAVGGSEVTDGSLTNSDIAAAAGIADSKLATISTAGKVSGSAITSGTIGGSTALSTSGNITTSGNVGIGTTMPSTKLHVVGGQAASGFASNTTGTINWNSGNIQTTSVAAGTLTMSNMVDGAGYTLVINNATGGNYTLSGTGLTFRCSPSCPIVVTAGADTVVAMVKGGTTVWVAWNKGFQ